MFTIDLGKKDYSTWVPVPLKLCSGLRFQVVFADVKKGEAFRMEYSEKVKVGKTWQLVENPEKKIEAFKKLIYNSVIGWDGIVDEKGNAIPFTRENLESLLNIIGNQRTNVMDGSAITEEKGYQNVFDWLSATLTDAEPFVGTTENL